MKKNISLIKIVSKLLTITLFLNGISIYAAPKKPAAKKGVSKKASTTSMASSSSSAQSSQNNCTSTDACTGSMTSWLSGDTSTMSSDLSPYCTQGLAGSLDDYSASVGNIVTLNQEMATNQQAFSRALKTLSVSISTKTQGQQDCTFFLDQNNATKYPEDFKEMPSQCSFALQDFLTAGAKLSENQAKLISLLSDPTVGCLDTNSLNLISTNVTLGTNNITVYNDFPYCEINKAISRALNQRSQWVKICSDFMTTQQQAAMDKQNKIQQDMQDKAEQDQKNQAADAAKSNEIMMGIFGAQLAMPFFAPIIEKTASKFGSWLGETRVVSGISTWLKTTNVKPGTKLSKISGFEDSPLFAQLKDSKYDPKNITFGETNSKSGLTDLMYEGKSIGKVKIPADGKVTGMRGLDIKSFGTMKITSGTKVLDIPGMKEHLTSKEINIDPAKLAGAKFQIDPKTNLANIVAKDSKIFETNIDVTKLGDLTHVSDFGPELEGLETTLKNISKIGEIHGE